MPAQARARGISLAAARGHAPRRLEPQGPLLREHQIRDIRRRARGEPTEAERRFLRQQAARDSGADYDELKDEFMQYSQYKRDKIRQQTQEAARRWARSPYVKNEQTGRWEHKWKWLNDAPREWGNWPDMGVPPHSDHVVFYH